MVNFILVVIWLLVLTSFNNCIDQTPINSSYYDFELITRYGKPFICLFEKLIINQVTQSTYSEKGIYLISCSTREHFNVSVRFITTEEGFAIIVMKSNGR